MLALPPTFLGITSGCRLFVQDANLNDDALFQTSLSISRIDRDPHTREVHFTAMGVGKENGGYEQTV